jgi:uncharacterized protein (DUF2336 family)
MAPSTLGRTYRVCPEWPDDSQKAASRAFLWDDPRLFRSMTADSSLFTQLEHAIARGSAQRRAEMLAQITDVFIAGSGQFSDDEIAVFDEVITRLADKIEASARALLARRLAPVANAPFKVTRILASDDEIRVAYPILVQSERVDEATLVETARTKSQAHLLAISRRKTLSERITDVLVERGDREVVLSTARNKGAKFSREGLSLLVERTDGDDTLAESVGVRPDIPHVLFLTLLAKASHMVQAKLIRERRHSKHDIKAAVSAAAGGIRSEALAESPSYAQARALVRSLYESGQLNDGAIHSLAESGKFEETTTALARLCGVPVTVVEQAMIHQHSEMILVLAKAAGLSWAATKALLSFRARQRRIPANEIEQSLASFERLKRDTAQQIVEFYRLREGQRVTQAI